jgi:hypothetical protein
MWFYIWVCHCFTSFLRGLFQYVDLHLGHCLGFVVLFCHVLPHLRHVSVGSSGMVSMGTNFHVIFGFSVIFSCSFVYMIIYAWLYMLFLNCTTCVQVRFG